MKRKKILLVWNYNRKDWIQPFISLKDKFDFIFLSKFSRKEDDESVKDLEIPRIYWNDYSSAREILDDIKPEIILFMSITNFTDIILNQVAKNRNIRTAILQHGLFFKQQTYKQKILQLKKAKLNRECSDQQLISNKAWKVKYIASGLWQGMGIVGTYKMLNYLLAKVRSSDIEALEKHRFEQRLPNYLLVYTKSNAKIFIERDDFCESKMIEIGNPSLDDFFSEASSPTELPFQNYILLIDTPLWVERTTSVFGYTKDAATEFYFRVLKYTRKRNKKLVIKLHPFSYKEDDLLQEHDVIYIRNEWSPLALIHSATGILSFASTLALPALYFKPILFIDFYENDFLNTIREENVAPVIHIDSFSEESPDPIANMNIKDWLEKNFLYITDGNSLVRLSHLLNTL